MPMKPLYWTRLLVPAVAAEHGSVDASASPAQVRRVVDARERMKALRGRCKHLFDTDSAILIRVRCGRGWRKRKIWT